MTALVNPNKPEQTQYLKTAESINNFLALIKILKLTFKVYPGIFFSFFFVRRKEIKVLAI